MATDPRATFSGPVPALWNDGKHAASHRVDLFFRRPSEELRICGPGQINDLRPLAVWDVNTVRTPHGNVSTRHPSPLRLSREPDDGQRLLVENTDAARALASWLESPLAARKRKIRRRWITATAGVWAFFLFIYLAGPFLFAGLAGFLPLRWEKDMGKAARDNLIQALSLASIVKGENNEATQDPALRALMDRLREAAPVGRYSFDLLVLDAKLVNAFALPGGYMVATTGLVGFCESPEELAGVLAHEMAHVTERHGTSRILRDQFWSFIIRMASGNVAYSGDVALSLLTSSFSRDDERAADTLGARRLANAGINPQGMIDFFARLSKDEDPDETGMFKYMASHPDSVERQRNIRQDLQKRGLWPEESAAPAQAPAMSREDWLRLRAACGVKPEQAKQPPGDASGKRPPSPAPKPGNSSDASGNAGSASPASRGAFLSTTPTFSPSSALHSGGASRPGPWPKPLETAP